MPRWNSPEETGTATLEFLAAGVILLVPLVYLVIALSSIQAGALAAEGAARQAARAFSRAAAETEGRARAATALEYALADYRIDPGSAQLDFSCRPDPGHCLLRQGSVTAHVRLRVPLPLVPDVLDLQRSAALVVEADATVLVSRFGPIPGSGIAP